MLRPSRTIRPFRPVVALMESRVVLSTATTAAVTDLGGHDVGEVSHLDPAASGNDYGQGVVVANSYGSSGSSSGVTKVTLGQYVQVAVDRGAIYEYGDPFPDPGTVGEEWYAEYYGSSSGSGSGSGSAAQTSLFSQAASNLMAAEDPAAQRAREIREYNEDVARFNTDRNAYNDRVRQYNMDKASYQTKIADFNRRYQSNYNPKIVMSTDPLTGQRKAELSIEISTQIFNGMSGAAKAEKQSLDTLGQDLHGRFNMIYSEKVQLTNRQMALAGRYSYLLNKYYQIRKVQP